MKFYIEFRSLTGLTREQSADVFLLRAAFWFIVSLQTADEGAVREDMYARVEQLTGPERQRYLREVYEPNLQRLGSDDEVIARLKRFALLLGFDVTTERCKLTISLRDDAMTDVVDVIYGDLAFRPLAEPSRFCRRPVFVNRATGEHYVKDDLGVLTKRFAFRSGNMRQYDEFLRLGTSRNPDDRNLSSPISANVVGNHQLDHHIPTLEEAIYIHQRYGSGEEQRGVCLSTTPHCIVSDQGFGFGGAEPVRWSIDLARIPPGRRFYNLYENPSRWIGLAFYRYNPRGPRTLTSTSDQTRELLVLSMLKNTELYLETLVMSDVADIYAWSAVDGVWRLLHHNYDAQAPRPALAQQPPPAIRDAQNVGGLDRR